MVLDWLDEYPMQWVDCPKALLATYVTSSVVANIIQ